LEYINDKRKLFAIITTLLFSINIFSLYVTAENFTYNRSQIISKSVSYKPLVPLKKVTLINFNENSYIDDLSYLAAIPTAVFNDDEVIVSNPILYYQDYQNSIDFNKLPLNARIGIDYFMDDWMRCCDDVLDYITLINVNEEKIPWMAKEIFTINTEDPYSMASDLALNEWSWSDNAVIAVVDESFEDECVTISNFLTGELKKNIPVITEQFNVKQKNSCSPEYLEFDVCEDYSFIKAESWWDGILLLDTMIPYADPDLQLYCEYDNQWMQTSASSFWNIAMEPGYEITQSYVYRPGTWRVGISDIPIKDNLHRNSIIPGLIEIQGSPLNGLLSGVKYHIDITKYPGTTITIPDNPPFGCKEAIFKLSWNRPDVSLGFSVIGPAGEVIFTEKNKSKSNFQEIRLSNMGRCCPNENYSICVFSLNDVDDVIGFKVEYEFKQKISEKRCDMLSSAAEGAILASQINAPLLYNPSTNLSNYTKTALYKLGVKNVYLVDIGNYISNEIRKKIKNIVHLKKEYYEIEDVYKSIQNLTKKNDIVFSTVDPWSPWNLGKFRYLDENEYVTHLGPAAFIASHHGCPVIIIENHPMLSSAVVWHNEFWNKFSDDRSYHRPSTAEMVLTGKRVYNFLNSIGFDKDGKETIITVADQYDIGPSWDRIFPGVAYSGRFWGTPVDCSCSISRNIFYPALIFSNPALNDNVELINGSDSRRHTGFEFASLREFLTVKKPLITFNWNSLKKDKENQIEVFEYPVLCSFVSYTHRFNERASKYYGSEYSCADGLIPGRNPSKESIDEGSIYKYTGMGGAYFPDMSESEIVPFYLEKGGYDCVFSTNVDSTANNLNKGVILWIHSSDGSDNQEGMTWFWDPENGIKYYSTKNLMAFLVRIHKGIIDLPDYLLSFFPSFVKDILILSGLSYYIYNPVLGFEPIAGFFKEDNPWRAYEWYKGSTKEPDTMAIDLKGTAPYSDLNLPLVQGSGIDWTISFKPVRNILNKLIPLIDPFNTDNLYDGVIGTVSHSRFQLYHYNSTFLEKNIDNLHSTGFISTMCKTAFTYFHLMMQRHGSVFQVLNPWTTSIYGAVWEQSIPRDIIIGCTAGEAYFNGISHVGNLYLGGNRYNENEPQFWWDTGQDVIYFGDPDLRVFVPGVEYSNSNHWNEPLILEKKGEFVIDGHTPFGASSYPNSRSPQTLLEFLIPIILICLVLVGAIMVSITLLRKK